MGHGIAQVVAAAGSQVGLYDVDAAATERARGRIRANLDKGVTLGKVTAEALSETMERIQAVSYLRSAVGGADLVIEAAPESLEIKRQLLLDVEKLAAKSTVL